MEHRFKRRFSTATAIVMITGAFACLTLAGLSGCGECDLVLEAANVTVKVSGADSLDDPESLSLRFQLADSETAEWTECSYQGEGDAVRLYYCAAFNATTYRLQARNNAETIAEREFSVDENTEDQCDELEDKVIEFSLNET
jgi:hypothetical protein